MTVRGKLLLTSALGALFIATASMSSAQAADAVVKAAPVETGWWYHAYIEVGGRFFLNNPQKNGIKSQGGDSLAKYYEYSDIKPGAFGNFNLSTGSRDGLYQIDVGGKNVGYNDQSYFLDASKAGEHYLGLGWDQTPHVYSMSAQTLYNGVGTNNLTLPLGLGTQLYLAATGGTGNGTNPITAANAAAVRTILNQNLYTTDLGIRRDTASVEYRYTPTDAWDIRVNYTNMRRTGTQVDGMVMGWSTSGVAVQVPKPVSDRTQNYGASGEYAGTSLWGQKFNFKVAYAGSTYQDDYASYTVMNPFCSDAGACPVFGNTRNSYATNLESLPPNNQANAATTTLGIDLPLNSRFMNTTSYTAMRQNQAFNPFTPNSTTNSGIAWPLATLPNSLASLPASSLNGAINTLLVNNVVTTNITDTLKSKLSYRYYNFNNDTPEIQFPQWVGGDASTVASGSGNYWNVRSLSPSYTKQNGAAELNWKPARAWNVGAIYGYERFDWTRADVTSTSENTGKVYVDYTGLAGASARASWQYSDRTFDNYNYLGNFGLYQWPNCTSCQYNSNYRQFMFDDRTRNKGNLLLTYDIAPGLTVSPSASLMNDDYGLAINQFGVIRSFSVHAGVELAWLVNPDTTLLLTYMNENYSTAVRQNSGSSFTEVNDRVNTISAAVNYVAIPSKLDLKFSYTLSRTLDQQPVSSITNATQFPDVTGTFQRFDAVALYKFDDDLVRRLGWKGKVTGKLRYAWERNSVNNWNDNQMAAYMYSTATGTGYQTWMAYNNPNYNVHMIAASLAWAW